MTDYPALQIPQFASLRAGYQIRAKVENQPGASHRLIQIRDFNEDRSAYDRDNLFSIEPGGKVEQSQILRNGDVLFLSRGHHPFACALRDVPPRSLASPYFFIIRPRDPDRVLPAYIAWFLNLPQTLRQIRRQSTVGAHMPIVRREILESLRIPMPPPPMQGKIARVSELARRRKALLAELSEKQQLFATAVCAKAAHATTTN